MGPATTRETSKARPREGENDIMKKYVGPRDLPARLTPIVGLLAIGIASLVKVGGAVAQSDAPSPILSLEEAVARALEADPELVAGVLQLEAVEGRILQSGLRPNPEIVLDVENALGTDDYRALRQAELTGGLRQRIELGGKRQARIDLAQGGKNVVAAENAALRRSVVARTTADFVAVLGAQLRLSIAEVQVDNAEQLLPALRRRVESGASSELDLARGQLAAELAKIEMERARADGDAARRRLASNWGGTAADVARVVGEFEPPTAAPESLGVLAEALEAHPGVTRWESVRAQREADVRLQKADRVPDVTLGVSARQIRETDDTAVLFNVTVPIPVFNRNQGAIHEARQMVLKTDAEQQAARLELYRRLSDAYADMAASCLETRNLTTGIVPAAERTLRQLEDGYAEGRFGVLDLLDANAVLANARRRAVDSLVACRSRAAEIMGLTDRNPLASSEDAKTP